MKTPRPGDLAWLILGLGVATYEVVAIDGELLSEAADRYMMRHPWVVRGVAFLLAAHVCNLVPPRYDPVCWVFAASRALSRSHDE